MAKRHVSSAKKASRKTSANLDGIVEKVQSDNCFPTFSFQIKDPNRCTSNRKISKDAKLSLLEVIRMVGTHTWGEIKRASKTTIGYEQIPLDRIKNITLPAEANDHEHLDIFRLTGRKGRILGKKTGREYTIYGIDAKFDTYEH